MKKALLGYCFLLLLPFFALSQQALVNTSQSSYAKMWGLNMGSVQLTEGFWAERFAICRKVMVPQLWKIYHDAERCHSFKNFEIAAGLDTGNFKGPSFHDGDFYKTLEAVASMYAATKDPQLDAMMDEAIAVIGRAQKADGYIYTKSIIEQQHSGKTKMFDDKLSFEAYNFGHLMTAACVHYRATGKTSLLNIARKATDFLINFYNNASPEQARNAICPSHYMGIVEMYRTTKDERYLALAKKLIDIRGTVEGTDDNSDRQPLRQMDHVIGHAVRANYLFAGVADLFAEDGDTSLLTSLDKVWNDVVQHKMYITGGCGALYDGVSVNGTSYNPDTVQKIHQAYGRAYELPNITAHNETCANIGNVLWNYRMLLLSADVKYADVMELALYNSVLSGVSLDGTGYFYTNPLAASATFPDHLRWEGGRQPYISLSNCCPPNLVRTIAELSNYFYAQDSNSIYVNMFGSSTMQAQLQHGKLFSLEQRTDYPWSGSVRLQITEAPGTLYGIRMRIPGWCQHASVTINGKPVATNITGGQYQLLSRRWKKGDVIQLQLSMPVTLMTANQLVEANRNQVAVRKGPLVYCLESADLPRDQFVFDIVIPATMKFSEEPFVFAQAHMVCLKGTAKIENKQKQSNQLYQPLTNDLKPVAIKLIPYYAWANRGKSEMTVWLPVSR